MGAIILATLLEAAPADVRAEFEHLGSCVLGDLAAAQAGALLEGLSSDRQGFWTACKNAGISRKQGGRSLQQEELRALAKDKLLAVLPAVSFQALLGYAVPGEMGRELEEYGEVLVAAQEAARVTELLRALGAGADELRKVRSVWGIAIRNASGGTRAAQSVRSELRGACIRFLTETPVSDALGGAEQGMTASAAARAGEGISPTSSSGALVEQSVQVTLAMLLEAAPADVHAEFKHLGSCVLGDLAAAQAGALLEGLSSDRQGLWTACKNAGISRKQGGRSLQQEELRALAKDKLLAVLPAVSFQALLGYAVPGEMGRELEEYGEVLVAAQEAARVTELLRALGAGADELRNASRVWGIAIRNASGGTRAAQSVRFELRGACIRFLKGSPVSDASGGAEQGMTASAVARAGDGTSPSSSGALVEQSVQVTLAMLLEAAPADVRAEFKHLGSCVLGDLAAAQAGALLEGLSSDRQGFWTACENAGISRKQGGKSLQQEELRALAKDKLLALLPAVSLQALLDYAVPGEMGRELEEYGEVLVAAQEAARVTELLRALGAGADELRKVSRVWGIAIRNASGRTRAVQSVRSEFKWSQRLWMHAFPAYFKHHFTWSQWMRTHTRPVPLRGKENAVV